MGIFHHMTRTQKSAIRWLLSPWDGSRCQDSIAFFSGSLSVILKVQTDETQLKINEKRNSFFFQPLSLLSSMTLPCGHNRCYLPILHAYWPWLCACHKLHLAISPSILHRFTVSMATESPWKDLLIYTSHVSRRSIMAEILGRSTGNHHGIIY